MLRRYYVSPLARRQRPADLPSERIRATRAGSDDSSGAGRGLGFGTLGLPGLPGGLRFHKRGGESRAAWPAPRDPPFRALEDADSLERHQKECGVAKARERPLLNAFPVLAPADRVSWVDRRGDAYKVTHR
jgi:hypothetical protein